MTRGAILPLFVPGNRPDRFAKGVAAQSGTVILDLEDAVAPDLKDAARDDVAAHAKALRGADVFVRINGADTPWFAQDVAMMRTLPGLGLVLPKSEDPATLSDLRATSGDRVLWALVETAAGVAGARDLARVADRLLFGSIDLCADLGIAHRDDILLPHRSAVVMAARLAGKPAPLDGVTTAFDDPGQVEQDARRASDLGLGGKMLIHPKQIAPARLGFRPSQAEVDQARLILRTGDHTGAQSLNGQMIDKPVLDRAQATIDRWEAAT